MIPGSNISIILIIRIYICIAQHSLWSIFTNLVVAQTDGYERAKLDLRSRGGSRLGVCRLPKGTWLEVAEWHLNPGLLIQSLSQQRPTPSLQSIAAKTIVEFSLPRREGCIHWILGSMPGDNLAVGVQMSKQDCYHRKHLGPRIHASIISYFKAMDSLLWAVKRDFLEFIARGPYTLKNQRLNI